MKKLLSVIKMLGISTVTGTNTTIYENSYPNTKTSIVDYENNASEETKKEQAITKLSNTIDIAENIYVKRWTFEDRYNLSIKRIKAKNILEKKEATFQKINATNTQLTWEINKFLDKYNLKKAKEKFAFSQSLAQATELYNQFFNNENILEKKQQKLLNAINEAITKYKANTTIDEYQKSTEKLQNACNQFRKKIKKVQKQNKQSSSRILELI